MLAGLLTAWARELGTGYSQRLTVAKLIATINELEPGGAGYKHPELRDAIMATASNGKLNSKSLGWWLRRYRDRTVGILYLKEKSDADARGPAEWWVDAASYPTGPQG